MADVSATVSALVRGLAVATAAATFLLILVGGLVHGTGSSLACPDWPTCYGTMMPKMVGGVAVEHSHRLAAGVVVILTAVLAGAVTGSLVPAHRALRRVAWLAVALVMVQALLGGITVLLRLPTLVSTLHTATSLLFFATTFYLAMRSGRDSGRAPLPDRAVHVAIIAMVAVYFQMVLGGLVRHSGAALACLDVPLCRGSLWPEAHPTVLVQALHRLGAIAVAALVAISSAVTWRAARGRPVLRALALIAPALVIVQIWLGLRAVTTFLDLATVEAHLGVATALFATQMGIALAGTAPRVAAAPAASSGHLATGGGWLRATADLWRLVKPRVTALVIITFAGGMWLAPGELPRWRAVMTLIGTALIVGAANTLNMFLERDADALMERTRRRPLPTGRLPPQAALILGTALAAAALPLLLLAGNLLTGLVGGAAFLCYVAIYTPLKRSSASALFVGAVPGALPPLMGWTAVTGRLDVGALALFAILFLWQIPHFLAIALYRADDYARAGFRVLPLAIGARATRLHIVAFSVGLVAATAMLAPLDVAGAPFLAAAVVLGAAFVAWGLAGFRQAATAAAGRIWARSLFFASIAYLTLLFVALVLDRTVS
jgi:protoheme IX farnesyltransferase